MNQLDLDYQSLLKEILEKGIEKKDRTGTGTLSVFGRTIRHDMKTGFPLLTTKKMYFKGIVTELLWFLRGDTNIKYLVNNDCHIWDGDAYKRYLTEDSKILPNMSKEKMTEMGFRLTKEEFINKIKTDDQFAKKWGELGPIYGAQWRGWNREIVYAQQGYDNFYINGIDQIANLINDLKTNPDSRRLMVNSWNVGELDQMVLPPCHYGFQVWTRELSYEERAKLMDNLYGIKKPEDRIVQWHIKDIDDAKIPTRAISLMFNMRSSDVFLGLPFNIASYGLLLEIIAKEVNMVPDELIGNLGDTHLYLNHIEQAKEQIGSELNQFERTKIFDKGDLKPRFYLLSDEALDNEKVPRKTREPFPLPQLKFSNDVKRKEGDCLPSYSCSDFTLENYKYHPAIKAKISN